MLNVVEWLRCGLWWYSEADLEELFNSVFAGMNAASGAGAGGGPADGRMSDSFFQSPASKTQQSSAAKKKRKKRR